MNKSIVFSGGGIKGFVYIGIIKQIEKNYNIQTEFNEFYGTSIGALIAFLLCISYTSIELEYIFLNLDLNKLLCIKIHKLLNNYGIISNQNILRLLQKLILYKNIDPNITYDQFYKLTKKDFGCIATQINGNSFINVFFSYKTTPHIKIIDSLLASMNIPFVFEKYCIESNYYIDGGFTNNFPIEYANNNNQVIGCYFKSSIDSTTSNTTINSFFDYTKLLLNCIKKKYLSVQHNKLNKYHNKNNIKLIKIKNIVQNTINFDINYSDKLKLIALGENIKETTFYKFTE